MIIMRIPIPEKMVFILKQELQDTGSTLADTETWVFWDTKVNIMVADALAMKVVRTSAAMTLPMQQKQVLVSGLILGVLSANERPCYFVTTSLIGWVQA